MTTHPENPPDSSSPIPLKESGDSRADSDLSSSEIAVMQQSVLWLEQELIAAKETIASRDAAITWLEKEVEAVRMTFEWRRKSLKYLLVDIIYLIAERSLVARKIGNKILPEKIKKRLYAQSLKSQSLDSPVKYKAVVPIDTGAKNKMDILCLANIEWSARYQRPQQMMTQFAKQGHRVFYIVRSQVPSKGSPYNVMQVAYNVYEVNLAFSESEDFYSEKMSYVNLQNGLEAFSRLARSHNIKSALVVVHLPYWTPFAIALKESRRWKLQYDCMDEWADFPGIGTKLVEEEAALVRAADLVTVTASLLEAKWAQQNVNCLLVRNAVDYEFFSSRFGENNLLGNLRKPIIGFYGALAPWIDFCLLRYLAEERSDWNFVLIGDCFVENLAGIDKMANVQLIGRKPYDDMPRYLHGFDVCLIPFKLNSVTHAVDPVKFYEFMSAGKPVVSVPLEEMEIYSDYVYFAAAYEDFLEKIEIALTEKDTGQVARRIQLAKENDWSHRFAATSEGVRSLYGKCSIVVVSYNNAELTQQCIESIFSHTTYPNYEIILIDNASTDRTVDMLQDMQATHSNFKVIVNENNRGFAAANNQGIEHTDGEFIILLNNDTVVAGDWLEAMLRHLEDKTIGMVGPVTNSIGNEAKITVDYSDLEQMRNFADRYTSQRAGMQFDISMLAMFCVAMRRDVQKTVGRLDEAFGLGMFEDDDYSRRMHMAGYRTICAEDAFVHHYGQASFGKLIESGEYQIIWNRNQAYFEKKWGAWEPHQHSRNVRQDEIV